MNEDRLTRLETLISHQEKQIEDLSEIVRLQSNDIKGLMLRLERTQKKLLDLEVFGAEGQEESLTPTEQAARDKPPHY